MHMKKMMTFAAAVAAGLAAVAQEKAESAELAWAPGDGISYGETQIVAFEAGAQLDSRYMTYGVIDGRDPILTPSVKATFFDWFYLSAEAIYDVTKTNGKRGGYGRRTGKRTTLDAIAGLAHEFELSEEFGTLSVDFNYIYEYFRRYHDEGRCMDDTQYLNLELSLSDGIFSIVEPTLAIERDIMADEGTYVNLNLGHDFPLIDGKNEGDDPVLAFRPSVGQGFGNTSRVRHYDFVKHGRELDHGGIMDTTVMGELTWNLGHGVSLTGYVAYSDYIFDSNMRAGARGHNAAWGHGCNHSWNFYGGVGVTFAF